MKYTFPSKLHKLLALILAFVLIVGLVGCSQEDVPAEEIVKGTVSADNLNVRKDHDTDSKVLGQLPLNLEIEILEQKTVDDTTWGRIDEMKLPDGTKIKAGWINLLYVDLAGDSDTDVTEPTTEPTVSTEPDVPTIIGTMGTVTTGKLNIRKGAGSKYEAIGSYVKGDRVEIVETVTVDDTLWGRTSKGWIGMGYVKMDGSATSGEGGSIESDGKTAILGYGVVDLGELNVRKGPGTGYDELGVVTEGNRYAYYQQSDNWVRIEGGWVSMTYFYIEGTTADDAAAGTVSEDGLNIRTGPSTSFQSKGTLNKGDSVQILAQVDDWGYTSKGWISMKHVELAKPTYTTGTGAVTTGLNVRKEAKADSDVLTTLKEGNPVNILELGGEDQDWGKIQYETGKYGWINMKYVKMGG